MCIVQPLEIVDRGSETQPQVIENLHKLTLKSKKVKSCIRVNTSMNYNRVKSGIYPVV